MCVCVCVCVVLESLMQHKNWCSIHARWSKNILKHSIRFCGIFFQSLKHNYIAYRSSNVSDCIFEIHQLRQSGFSRVYSNSYWRCSFELEIIKISQSSYKIYSNSTVNFVRWPYCLLRYSKNIMNSVPLKRGNHFGVGDPIYPTPPLGQDMTQGQIFLSGV